MGALKDAYDIGKDLLSGARGRKERADQERFNHRKEQLRMELETAQRTKNVTCLGFMPTTDQVPLAEALYREKFLDRDIHTGRYFVRTGNADYTESAHSLY
ncbi:MAG: hypothetical protein ABSG65_07250 [Bryobacteraceae bacterium]|jgi:hypothetical protein